MDDPHGLVDTDGNFVGPLLIVSAILVLIMLGIGLFMPNASWIL